MLGMAASFLLSGEEAYWSVRKGAVWWLSNRVRDGSSAVVLKVCSDRTSSDAGHGGRTTTWRSCTDGPRKT